MSNEEKMTIHERRKYLRLMKPRYVKARRSEKGQLLDEMEAVTDLDRKTVIRLMKGSLEHKPRSRERAETYGPMVDAALRVIDESFDGICAERLTPNLAWMARQLNRHGELAAGPQLLEQLGQVSISTVARRLARVRQDQPCLPRKQPQARNPLLGSIPMLRLPWDMRERGYFETDLVHHCGPCASGEYACTLQMIDVLTGWCERRAVLGRSYLVKVQNVAISRSRPYHKNDNPRVEQKNSTLVRAYLGYDRIDSVAQTLALNAVYDKMWIYYNLFQPVMHLVEKEVTRLR